MIGDLVRFLLFRHHDATETPSLSLLRGEWPRAEAKPPEPRKYEICRHCGSKVYGAHTCAEMEAAHSKHAAKPKRAPVVAIGRRKGAG